MLQIRDITEKDHDIVFPMVQEFYHSEAVDHEVSEEILERAFQAAADPNEPLLRGVLLYEGEQLAGYAYITFCYSAEVGGRCVFLEELFLKESFRGKGLGSSVMAWLEQEYPTARRFRLEVTEVNRTAVHVYQKSGYQYLRYDQMVLEKI